MDGEATIKVEPQFITDDYIGRDETSEEDGAEIKQCQVKEEAINVKQETISINVTQGELHQHPSLLFYFYWAPKLRDFSETLS